MVPSAPRTPMSAVNGGQERDEAERAAKEKIEAIDQRVLDANFHHKPILFHFSRDRCAGMLAENEGGRQPKGRGAGRLGCAMAAAARGG